MPRYFFNIYNGQGDAPDEEGRELSDLAEARREAVDGIRSILGEEIRQGVVDLRGRVEIADIAGSIAMTIRFADAVELRGVSP